MELAEPELSARFETIASGEVHRVSPCIKGPRVNSRPLNTKIRLLFNGNLRLGCETSKRFRKSAAQSFI